MSASSILTYMKPGFPKESLGSDSYKTTIEYVGPLSTLAAATPPIRSSWGTYPGLTESYSLDPIEGTTYANLTVNVERKFDTGGEQPQTGTRITNETTYEIDWVDVQRSLYEHKEFRAGGTFALSKEDILNIKKWEEMPKPEYKKDYIYVQGRMEDWTGGSNGTGTLSANAKKFALSILLGIEYFIDKAPVARVSDTWVQGPPPRGTAGLKETPQGFPNLPSGYEWIRSTDRGLRAGGQASWTSSTEWIGSKKVLVDSAAIFYTEGDLG